MYRSLWVEKASDTIFVFHVRYQTALTTGVQETFVFNWNEEDGDITRLRMIYFNCKTTLSDMSLKFCF